MDGWLDGRTKGHMEGWINGWESLMPLSDKEVPYKTDSDHGNEVAQDETSARHTKEPGINMQNMSLFTISMTT